MFCFCFFVGLVILGGFFKLTPLYVINATPPPPQKKKKHNKKQQHQQQTKTLQKPPPKTQQRTSTTQQLYTIRVEQRAHYRLG